MDLHISWEAIGVIVAILLGVATFISWIARYTRREALQDTKAEDHEHRLITLEESKNVCHQYPQCKMRMDQINAEISEWKRRTSEQAKYNIRLEKKVGKMEGEVSALTKSFDTLVEMVTEIRDAVKKMEGAEEERNRKNGKE